MAPVRSRLVFYFPGFDPLDAQAHHARYVRSAAQSGATFGIDYQVGPVEESPAGSRFDVVARRGGEATDTRLYVHDHNAIISQLRDLPIWMQIARGYQAFGAIVAERAAGRYFRHAWRFGLFFIFPYLLITLGLVLSALIAALPWLLSLSPLALVVSVPLALLLFGKGVLGISKRFHTLHLFADWRFAVMVGRDEAMARAWIDEKASQLCLALDTPSDEVLIVSHSMGASLALAVVGRILETRPEAFDGRTVSFVTLGGAALQCAFLSSASRLRHSIGALAHHRHVRWFDIQCLSDPIHPFACHTAKLSGYPDAPQPAIIKVKFKHMLSDARDKKNKLNFLRLHRQYVLGSDRKCGYDFTLLTAGPLPAASFAALKSHTPPPPFE